MKLEAGMYVRYKNGIGKIVAKYVKGVLIDKGKGGYFRTENIDILKASHNIIDLIEPMDLMFIDISPDDCGGIVVPRIVETLDELERWKEHISNGYWILKGIVTREQIEYTIYKVSE